jgi:hypothetical protein
MEKTQQQLWIVREIFPPVPGDWWQGTHTDWSGPDDPRRVLAGSRSAVMEKIHAFEKVADR